MRAWLLFICCSLLCLSGCTSVQHGGNRSNASVGSSLSTQEEAFAKALAHFGQGLLHEATQGRDSLLALNELQAAAKADPGNHNVLSRIAVIALHRKTPDIAVAALESSYHFDPKSYERCVDLAAVYHAAGMRELAIEAYYRALKRDRTQTAVYIALAGLLFENNESKQAFRALEKGRKHASDIGLIHLFTYEQAKRFLGRGAIPQSITCFERLAIWDEERRPQFYQLLAELHVANHDIPAAIRVLTQATELDPPPPPYAFVSLAAILLPIDQEQGFSVLQDARVRLNDHPAILFALGCAYNDKEEYATAIPLFEEAKRHVAAMDSNATQPNLLTEAFFIYHGAAYERSGLIKQAEAVFKECLTHYPKSDRTLNYLAYMLAEHNIKLDKALRYINRALKLQSDNPAYRDTLGWIYFQQGRFEDALKEINTARATMPDDPEILNHLGDIYHAMGNREQSHFFWKRCFIMDTTNAAIIKKLQENGIDIEAVLNEAKKVPPTNTSEN
jgi:tetratricopeptide (TPR) repeat protein